MLFCQADSVQACVAPPPPSAHSLVASADAIVRATAVEFVENQGVEFHVEEVLKGKAVPTTFIFTGSLSQKDDFNDRPLPYDFVRPGGRGGACYAYEYKQGAQFLLFIKQQKDKLTPYWIPLAPTNEQLLSDNDPWLVWVRGHLKWLGTATEVEKLQLTFRDLKRFGFDTDSNLLWGYLFADPDEAKLRRLGIYLETLGFRSAGTTQSDKEEPETGGYILRMEKVEKHTPVTLAQRDQDLKALAVTFGIKSYNRWTVSKARS